MASSPRPQGRDARTSLGSIPPNSVFSPQHLVRSEPRPSALGRAAGVRCSWLGGAPNGTALGVGVAVTELFPD